MRIQEILNNLNHRPWDIPNGNWKYYQEWNRAVFLHYQVDLEELKKFVPDQLEIDLFDGKPWISIVAFTMEEIRPKYLPAFPPISNFDEINIRTYVKANRKTGVYFLSIEGGKKLSCKIARTLSELPYRYSKMSRTNGQFQSYNSERNDILKIQYKVGDDQVEKTELDKWLTERYALFQESKDSINQFEIHHVEWPINSIEIIKLEIAYPRFEKLIVGNPDKLHYSSGVQVVAWDKSQL